MDKNEPASLVERLRAIKRAADGILAHVCSSNGRYLYDWGDCPNMIENLHRDGVVISAKDFRDLYDATNFEPEEIADAMIAASKETNEQEPRT